MKTTNPQLPSVFNNSPEVLRFQIPLMESWIQNLSTRIQQDLVDDVEESLHLLHAYMSHLFLLEAILEQKEIAAQIKAQEHANAAPQVEVSPAEIPQVLNVPAEDRKDVLRTLKNLISF